MSDAAKNLNYQAIWEMTENLPWCALVTTGRTGSDFFQSLLDSHPDVYAFNGSFFFYEFWDKSYCAKYQHHGDVCLDDIITEFIGHHIWKFKSKYDYVDRKDELGDQRNQFLDIDIDLFREYLVGLMRIKPLTTRYFLQAVYIAYSLCLGQDIGQKKIFFHHIHHIWKLDRYLAEFPESKVISMTRDPRATYVSGVEHWRKFNPETDEAGRAFFVLRRTIEDAQAIQNLKCEFRVLRLEDLGDKQVLSIVCRWLDIAYDPCLKRSTWGGLKWWGDRISKKQVLENENGFSASITKSDWSAKLNMVDKALLNYLLADRLQWYSYDFKVQRGFVYALLMAMAILLPTTYERRFLSYRYLVAALRNKKYGYIIKSFYFYPKRIFYFYRLFLRKHFGEPFRIPYFKAGTL